MTRNQAEQLLQRINTAFGGRVFQTDRDGLISPTQIDFYMENLLRDATEEQGRKLYDKLVTGYETISRSQNLVKFLKDVMPKNSPNGDSRYYPLTAYQLYWDLVWYRYLENNTSLGDAEVFLRIQDQISRMLQEHPASRQDQIHYLHTSPRDLYVREIQTMIDRLNAEGEKLGGEQPHD